MSETQKENVPKLRFPEFVEEWVPAKAGQAFKNRRDHGEAGLPVYSVTMGNGLVRRDSLNRQFGPDAVDSSNLRASRGELIYNMMRMWQGAVGQAIEECMVSPAYVVLSPKKYTSSDFFYAWFKSHKMLYKLWAYSQGLTSDRLRLYFDDFRQIPLHTPIFSEQKKIAAFLGAVDEKIIALRKKRDLLIDYKHGVMQQIFTQKIRFKRDDGSNFPNWENKRFGDVFSWFRTNNLSREFLNYEGGDVQNIHYGDIHTKFKANFRQSFEVVPFINSSAAQGGFVDDEFCQPGDVVIADASEDYADIGKAIEIIEVRTKSLVAGLHTHLARPLPGEIVLGFPGYILRSAPMRKQIMRIAQGISVLGVSKTNLELLTLFLPHPDEQRKIADFLSALDTKIHAVADQVAQIESFKKGLSQQMFV